MAAEDELKKLTESLGSMGGVVSDTLQTAETFLTKILDTTKVFYDYWEKVNTSTVDVSKNFGGTLKSISKSGSYSQVFYSNLNKSLGTINLLGVSAQDVSKFIGEMADHTGTMVGASSKALENYAALSKLIDPAVLGENLTIFSDIGYGLESATNQMNDMILASQKMGINASKAASVLKTNLKSASNISFKDGSKGIAEMARQSVLLGVDMGKVISKAKELRSPEQAIEFSQQMQMLGGSFSQLFGDAASVMYNARNNTKQFQKDISKAASEMVSFNETTGEMEILPENFDKAALAAQQLGMDVDDFLESGKKAKKLDILRNAAGPGLTDEQASILSGFIDLSKSKGGKISLTGLESLNDQAELLEEMKLEKLPEDFSKLTQDQINTLTNALTEQQKKTEQLLKPEEQAKAIKDQVLATQTLTESVNNLKEVFKSQTPDLFAKAMKDEGGVKGFGTDIQTVSQLMIDSGGNFKNSVNKSADDFIISVKQGADGLVTGLKKFAAEDGSFEKGLNMLGEYLKKIIPPTDTKTNEPKKEFGGIVEYGSGGLFNGPSHKDGGIKGKVKSSGKMFEVEGGEAIINKKSTEMFKPILSSINEVGGGVKFADGGISPSNLNTMMSKMSSTNSTNLNIGPSSPVNVNVNVNGAISIDGKDFKIPEDQKEKLSSNIIKQVMVKVNSEIGQGTIFTAGKKTKTDNVYDF
jgi:hypothetical protein